VESEEGDKLMDTLKNIAWNLKDWAIA
jgi:hypothetical protein